MEPKKIDAWITKYLFTRGIIKARGRVSDGMLVADWEGALNDECYFHGKDWHRTETDAKTHALKMVAAKRKTIVKQVAALDELERSLKGDR